MSKLLFVVLPALVLSVPAPARQPSSPIVQTGADDAPAPSLNAKKAWFRSAVDAILSGDDGKSAPADPGERGQSR